MQCDTLIRIHIRPLPDFCDYICVSRNSTMEKIAITSRHSEARSSFQELGARLAVVLLVAATFTRSGVDFFHDHAASLSGQAGISAPCNACDLESTFAMEGVSQPPLPAVPVTGEIFNLAPATHPYISLILGTSGRAPPCS